MLFTDTIFTSPLNLWRSERKQEIAAKPSEAWRREAFGENISNLVSGGDEFHNDVTANNLLTDEVVIDFYVLSSGVKHGI